MHHFQSLIAQIGMSAYQTYSAAGEMYGMPENENNNETKALDESASKLSEMIEGMRSYVSFQRQTKNRDKNVLWMRGEVSLYVPNDVSFAVNRKTILFIPSLINRSYIFDLNEKRSFVKYCDQHNINGVILCWGESGYDPAQSCLDQLLLERLVPAMKFLSQHVSNELHVLGYCMGGTLLAGAAAFCHEDIASCIFLATPWDFDGGMQTLKKAVSFWGGPILNDVMSAEVVDPIWSQSLFTSIGAQQVVQKFSRFRKLIGSGEKSAEAAELFVDVEDWLRDGVAIKTSLMKDILQCWFVENNPFKSDWFVAGRRVDLSELNCRSLVLASSKDDLVEYDMAMPIVHTLKGAKHFDPNCGHIGMIAGRHAPETLWREVINWTQ